MKTDSHFRISGETLNSGDKVRIVEGGTRDVVTIFKVEEVDEKYAYGTFHRLSAFPVLVDEVLYLDGVNGRDARLELIELGKPLVLSWLNEQGQKEEMRTLDEVTKIEVDAA